METDISKFQLSNRINTMRFDAESAVVGIDNRASCCISKRRQDFEGALTKDTIMINTYSGPTNRTIHRGILRWQWMDDGGQTHTFKIPNAIYDPHGHTLLSPQH